MLSAYLSIMAGAIETVFSVVEGHEQLSMALYGIALMAIVDITGMLFVWQNGDSSSSERSTLQKMQEARYSYTIGALMMVLGLFLVADR